MENLLISILFIITGAALFILSFFLYKKSKNSTKWNNVKGIILQADLDELVMEADTPVTYKTSVEYSYIVDTKTYYSKRIFYGDFLRHSSLWNTKKLMGKYKKGNVVDVYYNPKNPNDTVLQRGIHIDVIIIFLTSLFLLLVGIILIL